MSDDDDDDGPPDPRVEELLEKYTDAIGEFNKAQIEQTTTKREDERSRQRAARPELARGRLLKHDKRGPLTKIRLEGPPQH